MNKEDRKDLVEELVNAARCFANLDDPTWATDRERKRKRFIAARTAVDAEIDRLRRELEEARRALEPFAEEAAELAEGITDDCVYALPRFPDLGLSGFDVGDLRRARAALRAEEEGK